MSERLTASVQGPTSGQRSLHSRQNVSVRSSEFEGIDRARWRLKRGAVGKDQGDGLTLLDREVTDRLEILATERGRTSQDQTLGTGDHADRPVVEAADPGDCRSVVELRDELGAKVHAARPARDNPHEIGPIRRRALSRELNWAVRNLDVPVWGSGGGDGSPRPQRVPSKDAECAAGCEMALDVEGVENGGVNRQETLG